MTLTASTSTACSPRWATARTPARPTFGGDTARTAAVLGTPFAPWQRAWADVIGEHDGRGRLHYLRAVAVVPRRAGKTTVALAHALTIGRVRRRTRAFYAAHRRETAAAMWRDDWFPTLEDSPLFPRYLGLRRSNGSEAITWRHNRSTFRLLPPDGDAMRSFRSDVANIDEAREFTMLDGLEFEAACFPTQATGLGGQTLIWSNAGTASAEWLRRWRDIGRAATEDPTSRIAYLEFGAPDDTDPDDPATWYLAHPGLGHHVNVDALAADHATMPPDVFGCEYLGLWPEAMTDVALIDAWTAGLDPDVTLADPVTFALEVDEDRATAVIAASSDGGRTIELVECRPHGPWVAPRLVELAHRWSPVALVFDASGPAAALAPDLETVPTRLVAYGTRDVAAAAGSVYDAIVHAGTVRHRPDPDLEAAVAAARRRRTGGAWLWDRRAPGSGPFLAATLAHWAARTGALPTIT